PLSANAAGVVELRVETDFPAHDTSGLIQTLSLANQVKTASYLLHGASLDSVRISLSESIPSQYMRRLIAHVACQAEWDWKLLSARPEFLSTYTAFKHA